MKRLVAVALGLAAATGSQAFLLQTGIATSFPHARLGESNTLHSTGTGVRILDLPGDAKVVNVSTTSDNIALFLHGPSTFAFLKWAGDDHPSFPLYSSVFRLKPGEYFAYLIADPYRDVSVELTLSGVHGEYAHDMQPSPKGALTPLKPALSIGLNSALPAAVETGQVMLLQRSALLLLEDTHLTGPGLSIELSRHRVGSGVESECRLVGGGLLGSVNIWPLSVVAFHYLRVSSFVEAPGAWTLEVDRTGAGWWLFRNHQAFGVAVPLAPMDPLQNVPGGFWNWFEWTGVQVGEILPEGPERLAESAACSGP